MSGTDGVLSNSTGVNGTTPAAPLSYYFNSDGDNSQGVRAYEAGTIQQAVAEAQAEYKQEHGTKEALTCVDVRHAATLSPVQSQPSALAPLPLMGTHAC